MVRGRRRWVSGDEFWVAGKMIGGAWVDDDGDGDGDGSRVDRG